MRYLSLFVLFLAGCFGRSAWSATIETRFLLHDGLKRTYLIQPVEGPGLHPIVVMLHGGGATMEGNWKLTSLPVLGRKNGFILVAPQGINRHWNDGRGAAIGGNPSTADDVGFLHELIQEVVKQYHGDPNAVFMTGVSNGGFMTMDFACAHAEDLHAASEVVADLPVKVKAACHPVKPLPWLSINATDDPLVPFAGSPDGAKVWGRPQSALFSADDTFAFWANNAGCDSSITSGRLSQKRPASGVWTELRTRGQCINDTRSFYYVLHGAGHGWPSEHLGFIYNAIAGKPDFDIDAGTVLWDFFRSTLPGLPQNAPRRINSSF